MSQMFESYENRSRLASLGGAGGGGAASKA